MGCFSRRFFIYRWSSDCGTIVGSLFALISSTFNSRKWHCRCFFWCVVSLRQYVPFWCLNWQTMSYMYYVFKNHGMLTIRIKTIDCRDFSPRFICINVFQRTCHSFWRTVDFSADQFFRKVNIKRQQKANTDQVFHHFWKQRQNFMLTHSKHRQVLFALKLTMNENFRNRRKTWMNEWKCSES